MARPFAAKAIHLAVNRRLRIGFGRRIGDVIGADHISHIGLRELRIDVFELENLIIRNIGFGEQHIHMARHAACDRMNGVRHFDALRFQVVRHFAHCMLRLRDRHTVSRHDNNRTRILHNEGRIVG